MIDLRFQRAELEYKRLQAALATGEITPQQFERALEAQMIETGGQFWMLGANSGKWYVHDGQSWIERPAPEIPPVAQTAPQTAPAPSPVLVTPIASPPFTPAPEQPAVWATKKTIVGCGTGCLGPLLIIGGAAVSYWGLSEGESVVRILGTIAIAIGAFIAAAGLPTLLPRVPAILWFVAGVLATVLGFVATHVNVLPGALPWFLGRLMFVGGLGSLVGFALGAALRPATSQ